MLKALWNNFMLLRMQDFEIASRKCVQWARIHMKIKNDNATGISFRKLS